MCKTIQQKVRIPASPAAVYELLTDSKMNRALTGLKASIDARVGGKFSTHGGRVCGVHVELVPGKRVVQAWRDRHFSDGIFSMATFNLSRTSSGGTEIALTHRGVPKEEIPRIEKEWREGYWARMREFFAGRRG